jgi:predicted transcriptional regulator
VDDLLAIMCCIGTMKNRSRDEIFASILESATGTEKATKTKIMNDCSLSHNQMVHYAQYLIDNELLEYDRQNRAYNIKVKGLEFLDLCNKTNGLLKIPENTATPLVRWV